MQQWMRNRTGSVKNTQEKPVLSGRLSAYGVGKLTVSRRYNLLPLLRSSPGGFRGSWPYRTYPLQSYVVFLKRTIRFAEKSRQLYCAMLVYYAVLK